MSKNWKIYRAIYDQMGLFVIEGENPKERFEKYHQEEYGELKYIIGLDIGGTIRVELEGKKETLEYVLELIQNHHK